MTRSSEELRGITLLGNQHTQYKTEYAPEVLEAFDNKHPDNDYFVKFICPEFTSLCPMTGQPDFATIHIRYIPAKKMVESKSLKLYLFSFRNHGDFHEDCVNIIMKDLIGLMQPKYIEVFGEFTPRAVLPSIRLPITARRGRNSNNWRANACSSTICYECGYTRIQRFATAKGVVLAGFLSYRRNCREQLPGAVSLYRYLAQRL